MTLSNGTHIIRRGTCGSRITTLPVAVLLTFAINIGLMLVPGVASAELSSIPTENTWVTNDTVIAIVNANGLTYIEVNSPRLAPAQATASR